MHMRKSVEECLLKDFFTEMHTWLRGQKKMMRHSGVMVGKEDTKREWPAQTGSYGLL